MGYYRPRPTEVKRCAHCGLNFETNHKRAIYCSSSCRTLAYNARHGYETDKTVLAKGDLSFSFQNLATVATGTLAADGVKALFDDQPTNQQMLVELATLRAEVRRLTEAQQLTTTYINAQVSQNPDLRASMILEVANQNLALAKERNDLAKIQEFDQQIQTAQRALMAGR